MNIPLEFPGLFCDRHNLPGRPRLLRRPPQPARRPRVFRRPRVRGPAPRPGAVRGPLVAPPRSVLTGPPPRRNDRDPVLPAELRHGLPPGEGGGEMLTVKEV